MGERFVRGLALAALFAFLCVSWFVYEPTQWPAPVEWSTLVATSHPCGPLGLVAAHAIVAAFGRALSLLVPVALAVLGFASLARWSRKRTLRLQTRLLGAAGLGVAIAELAAGPGAGGALGRLELGLLGTVLGRIGTTILLAALGGLLLLRYAA
ncbi:MAG: DNA translocase FtsK 4TM domain-containing protein, partial [Candidatus Krumholzibacteriia bacterium]